MVDVNQDGPSLIIEIILSHHVMVNTGYVQLRLLYLCPNWGKYGPYG